MTPTSVAFVGSDLALSATCFPTLDVVSSARSRTCLPSSALRIRRLPGAFFALLPRSLALRSRVFRIVLSLYIFSRKDVFLLAVFLRVLYFGIASWALRHHRDIALTVSRQQRVTGVAAQGGGWQCRVPSQNHRFCTADYSARKLRRMHPVATSTSALRRHHTRTVQKLSGRRCRRRG